MKFQQEEMISATFQKNSKWFGKDITLSLNLNLRRNYSTNKSVLKSQCNYRFHLDHCI